MALYRLNADAKGLPAGTYLRIARGSDHGQAWQMEVVHHDALPCVPGHELVFQRAELRDLLTVFSDQHDAAEDAELIGILQTPGPDEDPSDADDLIDAWPMDEELPSTGEKTVGMIATDADKMEVEDFIAKVLILRTGCDALAPPHGTDLDTFMEKVRHYQDLKREILGILNGSSRIRAAADRIGPQRGDEENPPLGIYGLIYDYDPMLLQAAYIIRAAKEWLESSGTTDFPLPKETLQKCREKARAGEVIIRTWKKYAAYGAIWSGKKWISGRLADTLGVEVKKKKKNEKDGRRGVNPIAQLSKQNLERLKRDLLENAKTEFGCDPEAARKAQIEQSAETIAGRREIIEQIHGAAVGELEQLYAELFDDPQPTTPDEVRQAMTNVERSTALLEETGQRLSYLADVYESPAVRGMGLMPDEVELFAAIVDLPFTIKHATPNWYCVRNDGSLDSLVEFQKKNPSWSSEFSTPGNVTKLGNHGFVFFRVDVGRDPIVTRYGDTQIVEDLSVIEADGWISLFDQLKPLSSTTMIRYYDHEGALIRHASVQGTNDFQQVYEYGSIRPKGKKQATSFSKTNLKTFKGEHWPERKRVVPFSNFVFWGRHIRSGIALSLLWELRLLHRCGYRKHVLDELAKRAGDARIAFLRRLIGQTFRPEGKYPVALRFTRTLAEQTTVHKEEGDRRWKPDATANEEIMKVVKVIQRRKYLSEAVPQARKTYAFHKKHYEEAVTALETADLSEVGELQRKRDEQKSKMDARKQEWDELAAQQEPVEKAWAEARVARPELFPSEDVDEDTRFRAAV